jgi:NUMOD4 motif/HNH endonuclease
MELTEIWKDVKGYENSYSISSMGRVISKERRINNRWGGARSLPEKIMALSPDTYGYQIVGLRKPGNHETVTVHKLVALHFLEPKPNNLSQVNHKDGIKTNNCADNLEWVTPQENIKHSWDMGLKVCQPTGYDNPNFKLTEEQVSSVRKDKNSGLHTQRQIAIKYKVSPMTISLIVNRKKAYQNL